MFGIGTAEIILLLIIFVPAIIFLKLRRNKSYSTEIETISIPEKLSKFPSILLLIFLLLVTIFFLPFLPIMAIFFIIYWLYSVYKIHQILQEITLENYPITPSESVIGHLLMLFNFYWIIKWISTLSKFLKNKTPNSLNYLGYLFVSSFVLMEIFYLLDKYWEKNLTVPQWLILFVFNAQFVFILLFAFLSVFIIYLAKVKLKAFIKTLNPQV